MGARLSHVTPSSLRNFMFSGDGCPALTPSLIPGGMGFSPAALAGTAAAIAAPARVAFANSLRSGDSFIGYSFIDQSFGRPCFAVAALRHPTRIKGRIHAAPLSP